MAMKDENGKFNTALLDYVRQGSVELMQSLLRNDNSDLIDLEGKTLLHHAAESNNVSMTRHLINNNYNFNIPDNRGNSPLTLAVAKDSFDTTKLLIETGADMYELNGDPSKTLPYKLVINLRYPALNKNYELVKSILKRLQKEYYNDEERLLEYLRDFGCSLVQIMSLRNANMTRLMLENGYEVDERDLHTKGTALHEAVKLRDFDNVKVLLEFGASVGALEENGHPPLYSLFNRKSVPIRENEEERVKIMKILIEHGGLSSQTPHNSLTPVQYIFEHGRLQDITALMQYDVEYNSIETLTCFLYNRDDDALEVLRGKNIDVNAHDGLPLISDAIYRGSLKKVQFLLTHGADPNVVADDNGQTPLLCAFMEIDCYPQESILLAIIRLLLQNGADAQYVHTDEYQEQRTVFDMENTSYLRQQALESVVAHLALKEDCGETISELIRGKVESRDNYKQHFQVCEGQIEGIKKTTVNGSITLYKLLTESHAKITRYARNSEFAPKFQEAMKDKRSLDPYYSISLYKRVGKAICEARLREKAFVVMNKILLCRLRKCTDIFGEILGYLTCDDLKNICKVYDLPVSESFHLNTVFV